MKETYSDGKLLMGNNYLFEESFLLIRSAVFKIILNAEEILC